MPKKKDFDSSLGSVTRDLDQRLASRITARLGVRFNWSLAQACNFAFPIILKEIETWYEPIPSPPGLTEQLVRFPILPCSPN